MYLELDYIAYSVLEVMAEREGKKFYPQEILDDIIESDFICHDVYEFDLDLVRFGLNCKDAYDVFGYSIWCDPLFVKCKKYKKDAYKISDEGIRYARDYKNARRFFMSGFESAINNLGNSIDTEYIESVKYRSWCCHVIEQFRKRMDFFAEKGNDNTVYDSGEGIFECLVLQSLHTGENEPIPLRVSPSGALAFSESFSSFGAPFRSNALIVEENTDDFHFFPSEWANVLSDVPETLSVQLPILVPKFSLIQWKEYETPDTETHDLRTVYTLGVHSSEDAMGEGVVYVCADVTGLSGVPEFKDYE